MRLATRLREHRGKRPMAELARLSGVSQGELSRIERGILLPKDAQIPPLEQAYGLPFKDFYVSDWAKLALTSDEEAA